MLKLIFIKGCLGQSRDRKAYFSCMDPIFMFKWLQKHIFKSMSLFDNKLTQLLLFFTAILLFLPKFNLISMGSETAGVRIDDLILLGFSGVILLAHYILYKRLTTYEIWIVVLTGFSILSYFSNLFLVKYELLKINASPLYALRLLEYFLFFYIGSMSAQLKLGKVIIFSFFTWNLVLMMMQKVNLIGALSVEGYRDDASARVQGIASFPSEMGLILNLLYCYIIYDSTPSSFFYKRFNLENYRNWIAELAPYGWFALFAALITLTGNRISLIALVVCFILYLKEFIKKKVYRLFFASLLFLPIVIGIITVGIVYSEAIFKRSEALFSWKNIELASLVWEGIDLETTQGAIEVVSSDDYDMSWWMRIHKWVYMTKNYVYHPECYIQGLGPGTAGAALDGGILRIFVELGILGYLIFYFGFRKISKINHQLKWMVVSFWINMIFFDAYLAYKVMSVIFFVAGDKYSLLHSYRVSFKSLKTNSVHATFST